MNVFKALVFHFVQLSWFPLKSGMPFVEILRASLESPFAARIPEVINFATALPMIVS